VVKMRSSVVKLRSSVVKMSSSYPASCGRNDAQSNFDKREGKQHALSSSFIE
jgi:hypothetical protein